MMEFDGKQCTALHAAVAWYKPDICSPVYLKRSRGIVGDSSNCSEDPKRPNRTNQIMGFQVLIMKI